MLIATSNIDYENVRNLVDKPQELVIYVESLIPKWAKHIPNITDNQRFYYAIHIRKMLTIPYKTRIALVEALIDGIVIRGLINQFIDLNDMLDACNKKALVDIINERLSDEKRY